MSTFSIGQMNQLGDALEAADYTAADITRLGQSGNNLINIRGVFRGTHEIHLVDHIIDLSVPCKLPFNNAERVSPAKTGIVKLEKCDDDLYIDGVKLALFLSESQKSGKNIGGHDLRKELEARGDNVGGSIFDYLVVHPGLWPESWKKDAQGITIHVFFWGDIFRRSHGYLCVRCGYWREGRVVSYFRRLGYGWGSYCPSASLAS
ncbi:MAG: hypothetical protein AAB586_00260 [Patescibacteria group bacterium]